jgi:DNA-binding winged helix-turn-helix (wHTH) protein/predicted ATPase
VICFEGYRLDPTQGLTRGAAAIRLTPKSLAVLQALADRPGQIVTKEELFRGVWRETAVSDAALTSCIQEVRHALADDARHPRFIETLHRRGYRFIARISSEAGTRRPGGAAHAAGAVFVGRNAALDDLDRALVSAEAGTRQICFITGDAGVGKSCLLQAFLERTRPRADLPVILGQCVEQHGAGEPYQPLLEALMRLCRQPGGDRYVSRLERYAPTWLAQLPGLLPPDRQATLSRTLPGTTRDRMVRELNNAIESITADVPVILCIEDLHWSDVSTIEWIVAFSQRPEPARLLLVGTFRPESDHERSIAAASDVLRAKGLCSEIRLKPLDEHAIVEYVTRRFPAAHADGLATLARRVHAHAGGNPLYVVNVLADLVGRQVLMRLDDQWVVRGGDTVDLGVSDDVRRIIERRVGRLSSLERTLLEAASVAGITFPSAVVAAAAGVRAGDAESSFNALSRAGRFIHEAGVVALPDGTVSTRCSFDHALYQEVIYRGIPVGRRTELHRQFAECHERAYGASAPLMAAELAMHFEAGCDARRAIDYLQHAADNARRRSAFNEARMHFERALALIASLPSTSDCIAREANLQMGLGAAIMATRGFGAPEAEAAYSRARALCETAGETPRLFPALWGSWLFYWGRGDVATARDLATHLEARAAASGDEALCLQAHHAAWATAFSQGDLSGAAAAASEGIRLYDARRHAPLAATYGSHDVGVCARVFSARALALQGQVDAAIRVGDDGIALARTLQHPFSMALALTFRAAVAQSCGDAGSAREHAGAAAAIAREQDFQLMLAWCSAIHGWASIESDAQAAVAAITDAIAAARASGSDQFLPHLLAARADACLQAGRVTEGSEAIAEALAIVQRTGERFYEAELHRLRGELLLSAGADGRDVAAAFNHAIDVSTRQGARLLAARAESSLERFRHRGQRQSRTSHPAR